MRFKFLLATLLCFCAVPTYAQFTASIQGTVLDPQGGGVPEAKVTVTNQSTGLTRETLTSPEGFYRVNELPPGHYTITVQVTGFTTSVSKDLSKPRSRGDSISTCRSAPPLNRSLFPRLTKACRQKTPVFPRPFPSSKSSACRSSAAIPMNCCASLPACSAMARVSVTGNPQVSL